jgi:hypothetical protein
MAISDQMQEVQCALLAHLAEANAEVEKFLTCSTTTIRPEIAQAVRVNVTALVREAESLFQLSQDRRRMLGGDVCHKRGAP